MFLERKFSRKLAATSRYDPPLCPGLPPLDWSALPEAIYDVVCNLQILLAARRKYDHVLPDFGLSTSHGEVGREAQIERLRSEIPETFARYERRFELAAVDVEVNEEGQEMMLLTGQVAGVRGVLALRFGVVSRKIVDLSFNA